MMIYPFFSKLTRVLSILCLSGFMACFLGTKERAIEDGKEAPQKILVLVHNGKEVKSEKLYDHQIEKHKGDPGLMHMKWSTQSEENNFGFVIMRGSRREGTFDRVNEKIILGAGDSSTLNNYEFVDLPVKVGDVFFYLLQSVDLEGNLEPFSSVMEKQIDRRLID